MTAIGDLVRADRVHGSVYSDPALFALEMDRIYGRGWVYLGHEGEMPAAGHYRVRRIGTQPVIMVRGDDGVVRALMNRCTHRANALCPQDRGNTRGFTCPYHGWRFRLDGQLAVVPYADRYGADFDRAALGLRAVPRVAAHRGFVFASLAPAGATLAEHLGPAAMAEIDDVADMSPEGALDVRAGVHKAAYRGNWKFQAENSMDGYHANFTHRSYFDAVLQRTGFDAKTISTGASPAKIHDLGNGHSRWDVSAFHVPAATSWSGRGDSDGEIYAAAMVERHGAERARHLLAKKSSHLLVFPNLVLIGSHIRLIQPVSVDETEVSLFPTLLRGVPDAINSARLRAHESFYGPAGGGAPDDLDMFERNQAGLAAALDPWVLLSRGTTLEAPDETGYVAGQMTDELPQRALWREWRRLMADEEAAANAPLRAECAA